MFLATSNFLIPNGTFVVDVVIFLVVLAIVSKWILPPLQAVTDERRGKIRAAMHSAEEAHAERASVLAERGRVLDEARHSARSTIDEGNQAAAAAREAGRRRGLEEYERLMAEARGEIQAARDRAREELVSRLGTLVVAAAERVIGTSVDAIRHRELIDGAIAAASLSAAGSGVSAVPTGARD